MFSTTKNKYEPYSNSTPMASGSISLIAVGTVITGNFDCNGDVRIDGTIRGNVTTKGKLVLGKSAEIVGDIVATHAEILGVVKGDIFVSDLLALSGTASLQGDIKTSKLIVESGVVFTGNCIVGSLSKDNSNKATSGVVSSKDNKDISSRSKDSDDTKGAIRPELKL